MQHEAVVLERVIDPVDPRVPGAQPRMARTALGEDRHAVAAVGLRLVHRQVGLDHELPAAGRRVVPRRTAHRLICANANVPNMVGQISEAFGQAGLNIHDMVNSSKGDLAYTVVDLDAPVPPAVFKQVSSIKGVLMARLMEQPK